MKRKAITTRRGHHGTTICVEELVVEEVDTRTVELAGACRRDQAEGLQVGLPLWLRCYGSELF